MRASVPSFQKNKKVSKQGHKTHSKNTIKTHNLNIGDLFWKKGQKTIKFASHEALGIKINKTKKED
jgi:hypothetical protein